MYLLVTGLILLALKYFEISFFGTLSWWVVLAPFIGAALWWTWADNTGYTRRKAMEKMDKRKADRIESQRNALGMQAKKGRR